MNQKPNFILITLIIYTSDHASHFKTRNNEYKRSCHENSIRIPMVAYGPGFTGGKVVDELVSLIDIPATILCTAGIEKPEYMQGNQLQKLAKGDTVSWPQEVFVQISESQVGRAIRTKKWKYGIDAPGKDGWLDSGSDVYVEQYLYNLEQDPCERNNLVNDPEYKAVREELAKIIKIKMVQIGENEPEIICATA